MTTFADAARNSTKFVYTENGAIALSTTDSALLDLFSMLGAIRGKDYAEVSQMFQAALSEDKLLAVKMMFYGRNVRGGLGERETFRKMLRSLAMTEPEIVKKNIELIPLFGRYDDLYTLVGTEVEKDMWMFLLETIKEDLDNMINGESVTLCAKWLKSPNTSSKNSSHLGRLTARNFKMTEKDYRTVLSKLRKYIDVTERKMSSGKWNSIEYPGVPSYAMKNYKNAFSKHDGDRFRSYIANVKSGQAKINSSTLYPYDILQEANLDYNRYFTIDEDAVLEEQWKALPNYLEKEANILVMSDTSGSMQGLPMSISISLAVYFAERNIGPYHNLFLTFSSRPKFVQLKGNTLKEKIECIESIVENTNLEAAMELILKVALDNNVSQEEIPSALVVISDMQMDAATAYGNGEGWRSQPKEQTFHESMKKKFEENGYTMPLIVYWQVCQRQSSLQAKKDTPGVMLVSGASASVFKSIVDNIGNTPFESMVKVLSNPLYDVVEV